MPSPQKFSDEELLSFRKQGLNANQIAKQVGVHPNSVRERLRKLGARTAAQAVDVNRAKKIVDRGLAVMEQLFTINERAHKLLKKLEGDPKVKATAIVRVIDSILAQLRFQVEAWKMMWDVNEHKNFQAVVLNAIGAADPATRDKIVDRLNRELSVRSLLNHSPDVDAPMTT
ncbi:MAG: hypothetical protein HYY96_09400 [Candidatus Tectomicrobia bacterium]|nr:hypothetical protein [Candidatus Tectomicrobia bacterium]